MLLQALKKNILVISIIALAAALLLACGCGTARAAEYNDSRPYDYITKQFDLDFNVTENHVVHVKETIKVDFIQEHHGIERYIPFGYDYRVRNIKAEGGSVETSSEKRHVNVRIGDEDKLVSGDHTYVITYDLVYRADNFGSFDTLSLDLFPTGWETSVRESDITLTMPKSVDPEKYSFYAGSYGGTEGLTEKNYTISSDGRDISMHLTNIPAYNGVTVSANLPQGYWDVKKSPLFLVWLVIVLAVIAASLILLLRQGRKRDTVSTVEFYPPEGMTPAEAGYIIDGTADRKDLTSMILYYASKGYLSIYEYKKRKYELIKEREITKADHEKNFAITLFEGLFKDGFSGQDGKVHMRVEYLDETFAEAYERSLQSLNSYYDKHAVLLHNDRCHRYYRHMPRRRRFRPQELNTARQDDHETCFRISAARSRHGSDVLLHDVTVFTDRCRSVRLCRHVSVLLDGSCHADMLRDDAATD